MLNFALDLKNQPADLKKNKANIFYSWLLLVCFIAGQYTVYTHRHKIAANSKTKTQGLAKVPAHTIVQEKCSLCDAMHFNTMVANEHTAVTHLLVATHYDYKAVTRTFISFSLILSTGRAPPVS